MRIALLALLATPALLLPAAVAGVLDADLTPSEGDYPVVEVQPCPSGIGVVLVVNGQSVPVCDVVEVRDDCPPGTNGPVIYVLGHRLTHCWH